MKLLFDHNLSPKLVRRLEDLFPDSRHVFELGLEFADDLTVCEYADENGFLVVTKDADYSELVELGKGSPTIIWIRAGNCTNETVEELIRMHSEQILHVAREPKVRLLILF